MRSRGGQTLALESAQPSVDAATSVGNSSEDFRRLVDSGLEPVLVHRNWRILYANQAFAELLGYCEPVELLAIDSLQAHIAPHEWSRLRELAATLMTGEAGPINYIYEAVARDGEPLLVKHMARHFHWAGEAAVLVRASLFRQRAARDPDRHEELAHAARLSTVGALASTLAHELNQPLCALSAYATTAVELVNREAPASRELPRIIGEIDHQAGRAAAIVRNLRELVRKGEVRWDAIDLNRVLADAVELARPQAASRGVQLNLKAGVRLPSIHGNAVQLEQVVLNLLLNAIEALERTGQVSRVVQLGAKVEAATRVRVWVSDNGPGVPEELGEGVFEPFLSHKDGGLGLGLWISRSIVEAHGGWLELEFGDGPGATFSFTIPSHQH